MKWNTIKDRCVREFNSTIGRDLMFAVGADVSNIVVATLLEGGYYREKENISIRTSIVLELKEKIINEIDNWDIRNYKSLSQIFPKAFPKNIKGINLTENGWELY
tara:strand:+ start:996 stop:1310 length:315 start_codon:yes stop_codon:yes gene_type:complete